MRFIATKTFQKEVKKFVSNKPNLRERVLDVLEDFQEYLLDSRYYRKKLAGFAEDIHELQVGGDYRIIIQFIIKNNECYYLNFGSHSSLELSSKKKTKIHPL